MIEDKTFSKVCTETLEILANISDEEYDKIPPDFIKMLDKNSNKEYVFDINTEKDFEDQEFLEETYDMLAYIYRKYWCNENEKKEFKSQISRNNLEKEIEIQTTNFDSIKQARDDSEQLIVSDKNTILNKIKNMLKRIFRI